MLFKEHLDLEGSNCFTIFFNDVVFKKESSLKLKYSVFSRLEARWSIIHDKLDYDESAYMALIRNYNNLGWFDDADECNYQYRTERRWELQGIKWFIDLIPWLIFGYGVRIYFPLAWMTVIYIISAIIYWTIDQVQFLDALKLSAIILKTTTQVGNLVGLYWFVSIMERILGWLLMSAFLVSLAKKTLR